MGATRWVSGGLGGFRRSFCLSFQPQCPRSLGSFRSSLGRRASAGLRIIEMDLMNELELLPPLASLCHRLKFGYSHRVIRPILLLGFLRSFSITDCVSDILGGYLLLLQSPKPSHTLLQMIRNFVRKRPQDYLPVTIIQLRRQTTTRIPSEDRRPRSSAEIIGGLAHTVEI